MTRTWDDAPDGVSDGDASSVGYGRTVNVPVGTSTGDAFPWSYEAG